MKTCGTALVLVSVSTLLSSLVVAKEKVSIEAGLSNSMLDFAFNDLTKSLSATGYAINNDDPNLGIVFEIFSAGMGPQSFRIQREGVRGIRVIAGDSLGAMYGGLELAEQIQLGGGLDAVREIARKPYILRRGLKFNIPFDGRTPSYDDTGTAAQENILVMWDFEFWRNYLNMMARNRYNVLSLWTTNPYAGIVRLPKYPGVNFDDVARVTRPITPQTNNHFDEYDLFDPANHEIVKKISLGQKIAYWTRVFDYAESLGIDIYVFHWNIFTWGADGKHGITHHQDNRKTVEYIRYCVGQFLKTYPQVDGVGVSAGERVDRKKDWGIGIEDWLYETYGRAVVDVVREQPDRDIRFIFRHLWSDLTKSAAAFEGYRVPFNTSHKYARARLYSSTTSPYLDFEYRNLLEQTHTPCWLNLRNDDVFVHRWGDADYVREFMQNLPRDVMKSEAGYYMGSDSYVWGKEFVAKDPKLAGQWEVDKHWYQFMLWGRLGYDITLPRDYFEQRLRQRYPEVDSAALHDTWAASSQIIPQVNRFFFRVNDLQFAPEGCLDRSGFLTVDDSFFKHDPLRGSGIMSVTDYAEVLVRGDASHGITPTDVADNLDRLAEKALNGVSEIRRGIEPSAELAATLSDIESMAHLGRYYADKIRGAASLAVYRQDRTRTADRQKAVAHLQNAVEEWENYARIATSQYNPQLLSRSSHLDWKRLLEQVRKEARTVLESE